MKKLRLHSSAVLAASLLLAAVFLSSCEIQSQNQNQQPVDQSKNVVEQSMNNGDYSVVTIDSCEYVVFDRNHGVYNAHSGGITHKGNCKFCAARHSR